MSVRTTRRRSTNWQRDVHSYRVYQRAAKMCSSHCVTASLRLGNAWKGVAVQGRFRWKDGIKALLNPLRVLTLTSHKLPTNFPKIFPQTSTMTMFNSLKNMRKKYCKTYRFWYRLITGVQSAHSREVFFSHTFLNASAHMNQRICNSNSEEERPRVSKIVTKRAERGDNCDNWTLKPRSNAVRSGQFRSLQPLLDCWWKKRNFGLHVQQNMHLLTKFPQASLNSRLQVSTRCLAVQTQKNEMNWNAEALYWLYFIPRNIQ